MQNNPLSAQDAMRLASSPAGQQLIALLQKNGTDSVQSAIDKAAAGDLSHAKELITQLMKDPQAQKLLEQLRR